MGRSSIRLTINRALLFSFLLFFFSSLLFFFLFPPSFFSPPFLLLFPLLLLLPPPPFPFSPLSPFCPRRAPKNRARFFAQIIPPPKIAPKNRSEY